jgi:serine/threonine protein kinase
MKAEHLLNRTIAGYQLLEILGRGGMSIVFLAQPIENTEERVAVKILIPSDVATTAEFASFQARFQREARAVHQLHHKHILPVLSYGEEDGLFYMIIPVIARGTLSRQLAMATGPLPLSEIATYLTQLADAVDYAHQHGMVHRDIKPGNVLLDEEGNVYLADFGIVRLFDRGQRAFDETPTTLTTTGKIYGTPTYMAPERFKGEPAEPAADIYALGVLAYQLVTGRVPFEADNPIALGMKHLTEEPFRPRSLRPDLPEPAEGAILKALAKQPSERFSTAAEFAAAFSAGLTGEGSAELFPVAATSLADQAEAEAPTVVRAASPVVPLYEEIQPAPLVLGSGAEISGSATALASAPTAVVAPGIALPRSDRRGGSRLVALSALGVALLLGVGLLAFAAFKLVPAATPSPSIHTPLPGAGSLPTRGHTTPTLPSSSGATSTPGSSSSPTTTPSSAPTSVITATPASVPSPTAAPSPTTAPPPPTPTTAPSPAPSPTAQSTP